MNILQGKRFSSKRRTITNILCLMILSYVFMDVGSVGAKTRKNFLFTPLISHSSTCYTLAHAYTNLAKNLLNANTERRPKIILSNFELWTPASLRKYGLKTISTRTYEDKVATPIRLYRVPEGNGTSLDFAIIDLFRGPDIYSTLLKQANDRDINENSLLAGYASVLSGQNENPPGLNIFTANTLVRQFTAKEKDLPKVYKGDDPNRVATMQWLKTDGKYILIVNYYSDITSYNQNLMYVFSRKGDNALAGDCIISKRMKEE